MTDAEFAALVADPLVCPQLPGRPDCFRTPGFTYAQEWRAHIKYTLENDLDLAEDPAYVCIY